MAASANALMLRDRPGRQVVSLLRAIRRSKSGTFGWTVLLLIVLTAVAAPLIAVCYANFECRLVETRMIERLNLFVFEVVKAHVATSPRCPTTVHYRGDGVFMIAGRNVSYRRRFRPENL